LDITNPAKQHWNSISPTCQAPMIWKYQEGQQILCTIDEFCVSVYIGPDEMRDLVYDIDTMFDSYHSID
jgi:hypothetical protein